MVQTRGNALPYTSTGGFIDVPTADDLLYRKAHKPQQPKPKGLDWNALTPTCTDCHTKSGSVDATGLCHACRTATPEPASGLCAACNTTQPINADGMCDDCTNAVHVKGADTYLTLNTHDVAAKFTPPTQLPEADNQGQPTPGSSAPGPTSTSRTTRTARKTGPATQGKNPSATQETRPAVADGPTPTQNLDAQCAHATRVLRDTATSTNPAVAMARAATLAALEALHLTHELYDRTPTQTPQGEDAQAAVDPIPRLTREDNEQGPATAPEPRPAAPTKNTKTTAKPATQRRPRNGRPFPLAEAQRLYLEDKLTCIEIGKHTGFSTVAVRRHLKHAGTPMRDDRTTHSGGRNKIIRDPNTLVDDVRRLYQDERLTIDQVAARLNVGRKTISGVMARNSITARPHAFTSEGNPGQNTAGPFREEIAALGATVADIKTWALAQGLIRKITRGLPSRAVVQAYADAHPQHAA